MRKKRVYRSAFCNASHTRRRRQTGGKGGGYDEAGLAQELARLVESDEAAADAACRAAVAELAGRGAQAAGASVGAKEADGLLILEKE